MKGAFSLILLILAFNNIFSESSSHPGKEFYNEFLRVTNKENVGKGLSEQCFGRLFEYYFLIFKMSFYQEDFVTFYTSIENIIYDSLLLNCPLKSMEVLFDDLYFNSSAPDAGSQIYKKIFKISSILFEEFSGKNMNPISLGKATGRIYNLFRKNYVDPEEQNHQRKPFNFDDYFGLIEGLFSGMKKEDSGKESTCYKYVIKGKKEINRFIEKGIKGVENGKPVGKMVRTVIFNLMTVEGLVLDCNLATLGGSVLAKLSSTKGVQKLGEKFADNIVEYMTYLKYVFFGYRDGNLREIGLNSGKLISSLLDFYVH